jgi:UDP-glucose 4-epimerase
MIEKPIVITGARGRLAQALAPVLADRCGEVVQVSRTGDNSCLCYEDAFEGDVFSSASVIIHSAWSTVPSLSESHPGLEWRNDLPLLSRLLDSLNHLKEKPTFVFISSAGTVYGNALGDPSQEDSPLLPIGWYGRGKVAAEALCRHFEESFKIPFLTLRVSNPYGMSTKAHRPQGILAAAKHAMESGQPLTVWGDGSAQKDYLHIDDFCDAMVTVINQKLMGVYNLCHGSSHSISEVLAKIALVVGQPVPLRYTEGPSWDVTHSRVSGMKLQSATGWNAKVFLDEGIARYFEKHF